MGMMNVMRDKLEYEKRILFFNIPIFEEMENEIKEEIVYD